MNLPFEFHPEVQAEIQVGYRWYESQRLGLGEDFLNALEHSLAKISENEQAYGFVEEDVRAAMITRFPYVIYFRVFADRIRILAVAHASRNPSLWQSRD